MKLVYAVMWLVIGIFSFNSAFGDTINVSVVENSSTQGCDTTNECYIPYEVYISVGDEVIWHNDDSAAHTVTSGTSADGASGVFDSSLFMSGAQFSYVFNEEGTYPYFCMVHPWMDGIINVGIVTKTSASSTSSQEKFNQHGEKISNEIGTVQIEFSEYEIPSDSEFVKIFGTIKDPVKGGKIVSIVTSPDGTEEGNQIFTTSDGDYELLYELSKNSEIGLYSVFVSYSGQIIGTVNYEVVQEIIKSEFPTEQGITTSNTNESVSVPQSEEKWESGSLPDIMPKKIPSPSLDDYQTDLSLPIKKLSRFSVFNLEYLEEKNRIFGIQKVKPFPGYGEGEIAIKLISGEVKGGKYSDFKSLGFEDGINYKLNTKTEKIYLYEYGRQNILIVDPYSLEIIGSIDSQFDEKYRQRDINVNENTDKIYLLLEEMGRIGSTVNDRNYKIQVFDGSTKTLIGEVELHNPASKLIVDQKNNLVFANNWVGLEYYIINDNEELEIVSMPSMQGRFTDIFLIGDKNHLLVDSSDKHGNTKEYLIIDSLSGNAIKSIDDSLILGHSQPLVFENKEVIFIKFGSGNSQGIAIIDIHKNNYEIVKKIEFIGEDIGSLLAIDNENEILYSGVFDGTMIFEIEPLFIISTFGDPNEESRISEEYKSCWDEIRKLDEKLAKEAYSTDETSSYWSNRETMFEDMIEKCEHIKNTAIEEIKIQEQILKTERLSFPKSVDSQCDLVYLINRVGEERGGFGLYPEDIDNEVDQITSEYQQKISDEPWNQEELSQEMLDARHKTTVDSIMKKYSIDPSLHSAVSKLVSPIGTYDEEILRSIFLMKPEHYAKDVECGKMLKTHYYDTMYELNKYAYGEDAAEKMGVAIDEAIAEAELERTSNPITSIKDATNANNSGGCLIATATYGSELTPQVQQLRELRDNKVLQTESGKNFMNSFNEFYYSFSPYIADYEREHPIFKEVVKITITPMISSLSILNYVEINSEIEVLGYGISLILLNIGMYVGIPASVIIGIKKKF